MMEKYMSFKEFYEVYTKKLINAKYKEERLPLGGYRRIYETGDVYEHLVRLKEGAMPNWHGYYDVNYLTFTSKLNGKIIKMK